MARCRRQVVAWLTALALHVICIHGASGDGLASLNPDHSVDEAPNAELHALYTSSAQNGDRREAGSSESRLGELLGNETVVNKTASNTSAATAEIKKLTTKSERAAQHAVAKAQSDEAAVKAKATKKILKKAAKRESKDAEKSAAEAKTVMKQKSGAQKNNEAMNRIRNKARKLKLKQIYVEHVQIATRAKEYLHKVKSGAREAKQANATVEQMEDKAHGGVQAEVNERMIKAKSRIAATEATADEKAADAVSSENPKPKGVKVGQNITSSQGDENGDHGPMAKVELQKAVADAQLAAKQAKSQKTNQTAQDVASAAMLKVSQMTDVLKGAIAHDKKIRSVMSNEIDAKMRQVKSSGLVKQKNIEIRELKNEEDAKLKVLEKQREVSKIEASSKDKKADAKIDKKLEKEKEKRLGIKLKAKLLKAEDGVRSDNLKLKEKEEAKTLTSKESEFKASERTREVAQKRVGENRESKEKKTEVNKEKEKGKADMNKQRIKSLRENLVGDAKKLKKQTKREEAKVKEAAKDVQKANDKDMVQTMGVAGAALKDKLQKRAAKVAQKAKKHMQEAEKNEEADKNRIVKKIQKAEKKITKSKGKEALDKVKLDSFKARDQATLASEEKVHKKRELEKYQEKLKSKEYRAQLKAKLVNELKAQVKQEVEGPYKQKLKKKLKRTLTAEIKTELNAQGANKMALEKKPVTATNKAKAVENQGSVQQNSTSNQTKSFMLSPKNQKEADQESSKVIGSTGNGNTKTFQKVDSPAAQFALQEAENAAATAATTTAEYAQKELDVQEGRDSGSDKQAKFDWNDQNAYWNQQERMKLKKEAAANEARAVVRHQAAQAAVQHQAAQAAQAAVQDERYRVLSPG